MLPSQSPITVEEFHGPYGPYQVSELVLQRLWLQRAFDLSRMRDQFGRKVEVLDPGKWNRLEGPDFLGARLRFDGIEVFGDIEVHFRQSDWKAHGHDQDLAYDKVILHLLYFEEEREGGLESFRSDGEMLPRVSLLPLLWYSLEEYAADDSLIASTNVDLRPEVERLLELDLRQRRVVLTQYAKRRWEMKVHFARRRIDRLGWERACHQSALEVMGYARNRVPMLIIAEAVGLKEFESDALEVGALYDLAEGRWRLSGCRPANHPKLRLQQYKSLCRNVLDWPSRVADYFKVLGDARELGEGNEWGSNGIRREWELSRMRKGLLEETLAGFVTGQKGDTLVCDALLPLVCARDSRDGFTVWFHWNAGDAPAECMAALKTLQVLEPRRIPQSNGWLQGVLGARNEAATREIDLGAELQADA